MSFLGKIFGFGGCKCQKECNCAPDEKCDCSKVDCCKKENPVSEPAQEAPKVEEGNGQM